MQKFTFSCTILSIALFVSAHCYAQQAPAVQQMQSGTKKHNVTPAEMSGNPLAAQYYYRIFTTPQNTKGYDIFKNNRLVFHQPALPKSENQLSAVNNAITPFKSIQAQAQLSITKLKQGLSPVLTKREKLAATVSRPANNQPIK